MNEEKKSNMDILDADIKQQTALAANREEVLQKKLEEQFILIRKQQAEIQSLKFEVRRVNSLLEEKAVVLR